MSINFVRSAACNTNSRFFVYNLFIKRKGAAAFFPLHLHIKSWVSTSRKQYRMSDTAGTIADIAQEANRIIDAANAEGIPLRLLGGLAIYFQCPGATSVERLQRKYNDLDFAALSKGEQNIQCASWTPAPALLG